MRLVKDDGRQNARLVLIGEAPGHHENAQGKPFVGPAGQLWMRWLRTVGLERSDFYITNVYPHQPPKNKIERIPRDELAPWIDELHNRLAQLTDPWVIVPTGNTALRALVGKSKITKHRGSIYEYVDRRGRPIKVIPTLHPAAIFRQPSWERRCLRDWARIANDATFRELRLPEREHFISPTFADLHDYLADAEGRAELLALDIETPRESILEETTTKRGKMRVKKRLGDARITCVGFSFEPHFSLTIPTTERYWASQGVMLEEVWRIIRQLCQLHCEKALQNGLFDTWWLAQPEYDVRLRNWRWDTRALHHCLDVLDAHDLAYMASVDTREPYWKDEAKDPDEASKWTADIETFWRYNGKDAAVTRELADVYVSQLVEARRQNFYDRHYRRLLPACLDLMLEGVLTRELTRRQRFAQLTARCVRIQDRLTQLAGESLYAKKDLSTKRLARFLYGTLGLPEQFAKNSKGERAITTKEVIVRRLMLRYPKKLNEAGQLILDHRRKKKLSEFYDDSRVDADGRIRCTYGPYTDTLRLSSSKNPRRGGANLQNVDREARDVFIPEPGFFFLEADLSQAESRVVYCLTGDPGLIAHAHSNPWEYDDHKRTASIIFRVPQPDVTKEQRYFGKHTRHARHYGMRGRRMSENLLKEGIVRTDDECEHWLTTLGEAEPGIDRWQRQVRQTILRDRMLANSWGQTIDFQYERLSDELYRVGYAWSPQSEIANLLNQWGWLPLRAWIKAGRMQSRIRLQNHDALLIATLPDEAYDVACFLQQSLERPRTYNGVECVIPVEYKVGLTWATKHEFKRLPDRYGFNEVIKEMLGKKGEKAA